MITMTDMFCGAGGSSTGAIQVPGVTIRSAANHWRLAVDTHNTNHPDADHICADLSQIDPRYFPGSTILWASPSCTKHSRAQGKKKLADQAGLFGDAAPDDAAERSRATMWDVVRFAEFHQYEAVIVENVVDILDWPPYRSWLLAMDSLGYEHKVVYLNSMHAHAFGEGAPQSRDRWYCVFWRRGNKSPDLDRVVRPRAVCSECGPVRAMQAFKPGGAATARYRAQYVYRCANVKCRNQIVEPDFRPASDIIDWALQGQRIGDRARPLAEKTMARIQAGIERYWSPLIVEAAGNTYDAADPRHPSHGRPDGYMRAWPIEDALRTVHTTASKALVVPVEGRLGKVATSAEDPLRTMTTRNETGVAMPFVTVMRGQSKNHRADAALSAVSAGGIHHGVVEPPFIAELRGGGSVVRPASDPLATVTASGNHHGLVTPSGGTWRERATSTAEPIPTRTTRETDGIATDLGVDIDNVRFRMLEPREIVAAMDFPTGYVVLGTKRDQVRMAGNAVTPPAARDLVAVVVESLAGAA